MDQKRRGRPPGRSGSIRGITGPGEDEKKESVEPGPGKNTFLSVVSRNAGDSFLFLLDQEGTSCQLLTVDRRGNLFLPDYRHYTGSVRQALREYLVTLGQRENAGAFYSSFLGFESSIPSKESIDI